MAIGKGAYQLPWKDDRVTSGAGAVFFFLSLTYGEKPSDLEGFLFAPNLCRRKENEGC